MSKIIRNIRAVAGQMVIQASFVAGSFNRDARTVDVCFGTDAPILMGWWEKFYEILSFEDGHVRMGRLNSGAPMFDNHRNSGTANQPGVVDKAWVKDGKGYATLRFSNDKSTRDGVEDGPGEKIMNKVGEGIVRCVSIGYNVFSYEEVAPAGKTTDGKAGSNSIQTLRAIDWEPYEVSFVSVPADTGAGTRSLGEEPPAIEIPLFSHQNQQEDAMFKRHLDTGAAGEGGGGGTPAPVAAGSETRAAAQAPAPIVHAPAQAPAPAPAGEDAQTRSLGIAEAVADAGLPATFTAELLGNGQSLSECRKLVIKKIAEGQRTLGQQSGNRASVNPDNDETDKRRLGMENAILHRALPAMFPLEENGRNYRGLSLIDIGRECLEAANGGVRLRGLTQMEIAERSLNLSRSGGLNSTSDYPIILGNTINRAFRKQYELQTSEWREFTRVVPAKDFREKTSIQLSELGDLESVAEGGEYQADYLTESKEVYKVAKFGKKIGFTWETMINDDMDFLGRLPGAYSEMCYRKQADIIYGILTSNPVMGDGVALFHATHANLIGSGTEISIDNIGLMRELMREQKAPRGKAFLNIVPRYLIVGPKREQLALQFMAAAPQQLYPIKPEDKNVWAGSMKIIVEPRITDKRWYMLAAPGAIDTIEAAFLDGQEIYTSTREGWDVDGMETKIRMVMGAKAMDWRGMSKNPGVA